MSPQADLELALQLGDIADSITRRRFQARDLRIQEKPDRTPVTDADTAVETAVREALRSARPDDAFAGEETGGSSRPGAPGWSTPSTAPRTSCAGYRSGPH